jgi:hypothetical protein
LHKKICGSRIAVFGGICIGRDFLYCQNLGLYFMLFLIVLRDKKEKKKKKKEKKKTQKSREGFVMRGRKVYEPEDSAIVRHVCCLL